MMKSRTAIILALVLVVAKKATGWLSSSRASRLLVPTSHHRRRIESSSSSRLWDGYGVATHYNWTEEAFEIEVTVPVPPDTRAQDVTFCAKPHSIDLRVSTSQNTDGDPPATIVETPLLDGNRTLRGRVSLDGTYWVLADDKRSITVTLEKSIASSTRDDFEVVDYDWKGLYQNDDGEVSERHYDEPEELDVREYAASLGVDIDNINMSMVDKNMFNSGGMNLTRSTLDELTKAGYVQEVTQQSDGTEYITNEEGEAVPFSRLGDSIGDDEVEAATASKIPFLDTDSPWHASVPVEDLVIDKPSNGTQCTTRDDYQRQAAVAAKDAVLKAAAGLDPIDGLTVKRLKEILREQGLKVSGTKQELRDRLRDQVQSMVQSDGEDASIKKAQL